MKIVAQLIVDEIKAKNNTKMISAKAIIIKNQQFTENIKQQKNQFIKPRDMTEDKFKYHMNSYANYIKRLEDDIEVEITMNK